MALTTKVEQKLKQLFKEKEQHLTKNVSIEEGLQNYFKYRNLICEELYKSTLDLTKAKSHEWWNKHKLDEDAVTTIVGDTILKSIDTYDNRKNNKFVTFFFSVMNSTLKNHLKHITTKGRTSFFNEASFKDAAEKEAHKSGVKNKANRKRNIEQLYTLSEAMNTKGVEQFESGLNAMFYTDYMLERLRGKERTVFEGLLRGETNREIAVSVCTSPFYVGLLVKKIQKKFKRIELELCQNEKIY